MAAFPSVAFGVLADARARQHRRRRMVIGCTLVVAVLSALVGYEAATGTGGAPHAGAPITEDSAASSHGTSLQLPYRHATDTFRISAPAGRAYDVTLSAPAGSAIAMAMYIGPGTGWTLTTRDTTDCRASAGRTVCLLHFAAGGNPGGTWNAVVRKISVPAATVRIHVTFNRHVGDYSPT